MSECFSISCCQPSWADYSLNRFPLYTNNELTFFIPCPPGFTCASGSGVTITIPAGSIQYRPTTSAGNSQAAADAAINEQAQQQAEREAQPMFFPQLFYYFNGTIVYQCLPDQVGNTGSHPFFTGAGTLVVPPGTFASTISVDDANAKAIAYATPIWEAQANCRWENDYTTCECPEGYSGGPFEILAGVFSSTISKEDANHQAEVACQQLAEAGCTPPCETDLNGVPDLSEPDNTSYGNVVHPHYNSDNYVSWGTPPFGEFVAKFVQGAYTQLGESLVGPGDERKVWSANRMSIYSNGVLTQGIPDITPPIEYEKIGGVTTNYGGNQAAVEAILAGFQSVSFYHRENQCELRFTRIAQVPPYFQGTMTNTSGSPGVTYELVRIRKFIEEQPLRIRIADFAAFTAAVDPCPGCFGATVEPVWDGTMPDQNLITFDTLYWIPNVDQQFKGKVIYPSLNLTSNTLAPSGKSWAFAIYCFDGANFPLVCYYQKWSGLTPVGRYTRRDHTVDGVPCNLLPNCLDIEEY